MICVVIIAWNCYMRNEKKSRFIKQETHVVTREHMLYIWYYSTKIVFTVMWLAVRCNVHFYCRCKSNVWPFEPIKINFSRGDLVFHVPDFALSNQHLVGHLPPVTGPIKITRVGGTSELFSTQTLVVTKITIIWFSPAPTSISIILEKCNWILFQVWKQLAQYDHDG